jgi:putative RecB family exonuclease
LPLIPTVSPSLAETLRNCPLQAGIWRIKAVWAYVLGNPKAWLGTAYHQVLEHLWDPSPLGDEARIEELWANAIGMLQAQAKVHPLNKRFADPERWPGYHLVHAFSLLRAEQALCDQPRVPATIAATAVIREQGLSAMSGKLIGKPDVIIGNEIRDYKSGRIYDETADGKQTIKQAYVRQLRLYGRLVQEHMGVCPTKGTLLPMQGEAVEVSLDSEACEAEATDAVGLLDAYNHQLQSASTVSDLATPSPRVCRWCQYKALCPAFWGQVNETWTEGLGSACVRGTLADAPQHIHNAKAFALIMKNTNGTTTGLATIAPLERTVHANVGSWQSGDVVRIINLYQRNDGQLAPTTATVCLREDDLVTFTLPSPQHRSAELDGL